MAENYNISKHLDKEIIEEKINRYKIIYHIDKKYGQGTIIEYTLFDGLKFVFNDFHMIKSIWKTKLDASTQFLEINYCVTGNFECVFHNNTVFLFKDGELCLNTSDISKQVNWSTYHHNFYKGITIMIEINVFYKAISKFLNTNKIHLNHIYNYLNKINKPLILKKNMTIEHIFSELYNVNNEMELEYYKIKVTELIMMLCSFEIEKTSNHKNQYMTKYVLTKIQQAKVYIDKYFNENITIKEISKNTKLSPTVLKNGFKELFGITIGKYIRQVKMHEAKKYLLKTDMKIIDIASQIGYANPSKFAHAFKKITDCTPLQYRRKYQ